MNLGEWEARFERQVRGTCHAADPAHDVAHFKRVVGNAKRLAAVEKGRLAVVVPAAWLHDFVIVPKDSPQRAEASRLSADGASEWLAQQGYDSELLPEIHHAIHAHSFSARVEARTLEAKIVQDADRLDALGAVGIARCLMLGALMGRPLYDEEEPIPRRRSPDDQRSSLDHFFTKLLGLAATMQTASGRTEAEQRTRILRLYLDQLEGEIA